MTPIERAAAKRIRRAGRTQPSAYAVGNAADEADADRRRWWDRSWAKDLPSGDEPEARPQRIRRPKDVALRTALAGMKASMQQRRSRLRPQGGAR